MTRFALLTLAYAVPTFILGYLWHLKLFAGTYRELRIYRGDIIVPFGFVAIFVQGAMIAWLYPRLVSAPGTLPAALVFALGAALASWTFTTLAVAAKHPMTSVPRFVLIETAFTAVQFLLVAIALALAS